MAKRKTRAKRAKPIPIKQQPPPPSTGNALKAVRDDCFKLGLLIAETLVEKHGAEHVKSGFILPPELVSDLELEEGVHFRYANAAILDPLTIPPVALVRLARKLHLTRESADQEEGTYFPLQVAAWIKLYPELL